MLQSLLRDRFNLRARVEKRELPAFALVLGRANGTLGPVWRRSKTDCAAYSEALARSGRLEVARQAGPAECGLMQAVARRWKVILEGLRARSQTCCVLSHGVRM